ncbi:shikimate dehydrogenase [Brackiella oedipodis]|uniref:shikimate dehydrogenase n=1 Tax=Brackiella oedipodis TaxID=124225 RepID=UPI00048EDCD6|nr:shikimate dehydrogenase [Brackiella oedipodis]
MSLYQFAVFGNPVAHSVSPLLHQFFAQSCGISLQYQKITVPEDQFSNYVQDFFAKGGRGLNITVPFKLQAYDLAQQLSARAQSAHAVNTLWMSDSQLQGCNTDGVGLVNDLKRLQRDLSQSRVLLIGAGGAARGAVLPLLQSSCSALHIANRTAHKALNLMHTMHKHASSEQQLSASGLDELAQLETRFDIIINASASSLHGQALCLPKHLYSADCLAYDMLYSANGQTAFLEQAAVDGASQCADGLGMLVYQGAESFYIWLQQRPDAAGALQYLRHTLQA